MSTAILLVSLVLISVALLAFIVDGVVKRAYTPRLITCPATNTAEKVQYDPDRAALTLLTGGEQCVTNCTRWPAQAGCPQGCKHQINP